MKLRSSLDQEGAWPDPHRRVGSSWMLRAAAAPELFLTRGFVERLKRLRANGEVEVRSRTSTKKTSVDLGVELPRELARFLDAVGRQPLGDYLPRIGHTEVGALLKSAKRSALSRARLVALLAGAVPFGTTRSGELWIYFLGERTRGVVATLDPNVPAAPTLAGHGAGGFAVARLFESLGEELLPSTRSEATSGTLQEARDEVQSAFTTATMLTDLLVGTDAQAKRAARRFGVEASRAAADETDLERPRKARGSTRRLKTKKERGPLALAKLVAGFFSEGAASAVTTAASPSRDAVVREAAALFASALEPKPKAALPKDLARRRTATLRLLSAPRSAGAKADITRKIIASLDTSRAGLDPTTATAAREEELAALAELGDRSVLPVLIARAVTGDVAAVDMIAALGDRSITPHLLSLLGRERQGLRQLETAVVRALGVLGARESAPVLRATLAANPMPSWREGIERAPLVRELVTSLGLLEDASAGAALVAILESKSQEYRATRPIAAWALGRIRHLAALPMLEAFLVSPKETVTCEAIWAIGAIGAVHPSARTSASALLERLGGLEPGAEMTRLTALAKMRTPAAGGPTALELRAALDRALWEPGFRQEETSKRRTWALRSLAELAPLFKATKPRPSDTRSFFLGGGSVRYLVTRDDHRVREAAVAAFTAWDIPIPTTNRYFAVAVEQLERRGGLDALHAAIRDPLGVFRHNVASRLATRGHPSSVRPLAEATARLFDEPPTSTYEYDDAPPHIVAFVRALAKLNRREGNDVLIAGLRSGNHQVRAVVAENVPDDPRFVPELEAMLADPRSFLRSRAEKSLASLGALPQEQNAQAPTDPPPRLAPV